VEVQKYSAFTTNEKRIIIFAGSLAGFFSPLSSSIYFPALNTISAALNVSSSKINLTITSYVILQGIAPMMIAGFSDNVGRRPAYLICFTIFMFANLGLGLQNSYAALLVLRCIQSAGSSGTVALSNGLVGDTVTSEERGSYIAFASLGGLLGPAIAPIIGGAISQTLDWHWIFWFLLIFAGAFCVPLFLFLPETCRKIVGDGSIPPPKWHWCLTDTIRYRRRQKQGIEVDKIKQEQLRENIRFQLPNPIPTILIIFDPESLIILIATGLCLACFYAISTGAASSFGDVYGFDDIQIALMFIPISGGGALAALTTGKMIDWNYHRHARKQGINIVKGVRQNLTDFPIEKARMEVGIPTSILCTVFVIGYGWTMDHKVSLAGPIILIFLVSLPSPDVLGWYPASQGPWRAGLGASSAKGVLSHFRGYH
jgi:multidrug resistance protein